MNRLLQIHFSISSLFLIVCFILHIFIRPYGAFPWLNFLLFFSLFIATILNPIIAVGILTFIAPFTSNVYEQVKAIFKVEIFTLDLISIDASIGFLSGILFLSLLKKKWQFNPENIKGKTQNIVLLLLSFHAIIVMTVAIGISRNLYQATSPFSVKGFFYNLANIRYIVSWQSFHNDYFPLRDLFIFTTVITLSIILLSLIRTTSHLRRIILAPLSAATVIILAYGLLSKLTGIGYHSLGVSSDGMPIAVNSFLSDIHTYGGYALAAFLGGLYYLSSPRQLVKLAAGAFSLLAAIGVLTSGSRFSIVMLIVSSLIYISFFLIKKRHKNILVFVFAVLATGVGLLLLNYWGDRGLLRDLALVPKAKSFNDINLALSYRPEIFSSNLLMYSYYPLLGIGKGIFYRQSSIYEFSRSYFFAQLTHGENAHNYFFQILVETGLIGLIIFCSIFIYQAFYLRNRHNEIISLLTLGIFLGNLYAHSLLIPNILVLLFVLVGSTNIEVEENTNPVNLLFRSLSKPWGYLVLATATALVISSIVEVKTSYGKLPFQQRFICQEQEYYSDSQTGGSFAETYKVSGKNLQIEYTVHHPDVPKHPLTIAFKLDKEGQSIASDERLITVPGHYEENFDISPLTPGSDILLKIKTSRCFTPINWGLNWDTRRLGIQINQISQE